MVLQQPTDVSATQNKPFTVLSSIVQSIDLLVECSTAWPDSSGWRDNRMAA